MIKQLLGLTLFVVWSSQTVAQTDACSRISAMTTLLERRNLLRRIPRRPQRDGTSSGIRISSESPRLYRRHSSTCTRMRQTRKAYLFMVRFRAIESISVANGWCMSLRCRPGRRYVETRHVAVEGVLDSGFVQRPDKGRKQRTEKYRTGDGFSSLEASETSLVLWELTAGASCFRVTG